MVNHTASKTASIGAKVAAANGWDFIGPVSAQNAAITIGSLASSQPTIVLVEDIDALSVADAERLLSEIVS